MERNEEKDQIQINPMTYSFDPWDDKNSRNLFGVLEG
jgi:hypothetical protein